MVLVARHGVDAAARTVARVRRALPRAWLLAVHRTEEPDGAARLVEAGADGVAGAEHGRHGLVRVLTPTAAWGRAPLPVAPHAVAPRDRSHLRFLTPRERLTLDLLGQAFTTEDLAVEMCVASSTARGYVQNVLEKLGVHSRLEAVAYAESACPQPSTDPATQPADPVAAPSLLVVDAERLFAEALGHALGGEAYGHHVWTAGTASEALVLARRLAPAALLVGQLQGPGQSDVLARFHRELPDTPLVMCVPGNGSEAQFVSGIRQGARGWVSRDDDLDHVARVLDRVRLGEWWWPRALLGAAVQAHSRADHAPAVVRLARLTSRELQILEAMTRGVPRAVIAADHRLSVNTVRTHVQHVLAKLEVHSSLEAVAMVRSQGGLRQDAGQAATASARVR